jgi:DNA-binding transcriptional MerR regulator
VRLTPLPGEYEVVKEMHQLRQQGYSLREIVELLNSRGVSTKTGKSKWHPQVVKEVLDRTADLICQDESLSCEQVDTLLHDVTGALYQVNCQASLEG